MSDFRPFEGIYVTDYAFQLIESTDDRTLAERGRPSSQPVEEELVGKGKRRIYKSRYDSISCFIYQGVDQSTNGKFENRVLNMYNDIPVPIDEESFKILRKAGVDPALSQHIAHLFIRDPLVIFDGSVEEVDDETQTEHFDSIQSTNWYVLIKRKVIIMFLDSDDFFDNIGKQYDGSLHQFVTAPTTPILAGGRSSGVWKCNSLISRTLRLQCSLFSSQGSF